MIMERDRDLQSRVRGAWSVFGIQGQGLFKVVLRLLELPLGQVDQAQVIIAGWVIRVDSDQRLKLLSGLFGLPPGQMSIPHNEAGFPIFRPCLKDLAPLVDDRV